MANASKFRVYSEKFQQLSVREQALLALTGIVAIVMILFSTLVDSNLSSIRELAKQNRQLLSDNNAMQAAINELQAALQQDPNARVKQQIAEYRQKLTQVDQRLLALTSELINPVEMRQALSELLKGQHGVSLVSFEVMPVEPIQLTSESTVAAKSQQSAAPLDATTQAELGLYRHGIKLKLSGGYFQLRDCLRQMEQLPWKFFWLQFDYQRQAYPLGELEIEMYSLSTKREFIGV